MSKIIFHLTSFCCGRKQKKKKGTALTGNRTRASRVAGENSTTEPSVLDTLHSLQDMLCYSGAGLVSIKASNFPVHQQRQQVGLSNKTHMWL